MTTNRINYELNAARLQQAVLCVDCDVISDSPDSCCLVCGSRSLLPLSRVLNAEQRPCLPNAPKQREDRVEAPAQILLLVPSTTHRSRHRARA